MAERQKTLLQLLGLFVLAAAIRLLYVKLASVNLGFERFALFAIDSNLYLAVADHIISWHEEGSYGLLRVGPGYALILAAIKLIFGSNLIWPILFSVLMGGLAPVFVYLLAYDLFQSRPIALLAGGFGAVSLTSVTLSCFILTDQSFFTIHAAALVCFVRGYRTNRVIWYVLAGLLAGFAALVRPAGQFWFVIFVFLAFVIPVNWQCRARWQFVSRAGITGLVMLLMVLGWSARNYAIHDLFIFGTNSMLTVRHCLVAQVASVTWGENKTPWDYRNEWTKEDGDGDPITYPLAYNKAKARVIREFKASPTLMIQFYFKNVKDNMLTDNFLLAKQIPQMSKFMDNLNWLVRNYLGYLLILITLAGLAIMAVKRQLLAAWILGAAYVYFSILLGASFWQGSRLHYPAEMAWSIVAAYVVVLAAQQIKVSWVRRRARRRA